MLVLAGNEATQEASTSKATTISIKSQNYTSAVSTITFPEDAPGATVSTPYNDIDTSSNSQAFGTAGNATPVVTLVNSASATYTISYNITTFTNSTVSSENYTIIAKGGACANAAAIDQTVTFDADTQAAGTITTINATGEGDAAKRDLYLKIVLSDVAGKSGTSTITILGES